MNKIMFSKVVDVYKVIDRKSCYHRPTNPPPKFVRITISAISAVFAFSPSPVLHIILSVVHEVHRGSVFLLTQACILWFVEYNPEK